MIRRLRRTAEGAVNRAKVGEIYVCPLEVSQGGYCRLVYVSLISPDQFDLQSGEVLKSPTLVKLNGLWQRCLDLQ